MQTLERGVQVQALFNLRPMLFATHKLTKANDGEPFSLPVTATGAIEHEPDALGYCSIRWDNGQTYSVHTSLFTADVDPAHFIIVVTNVPLRHTKGGEPIRDKAMTTKCPAEQADYVSGLMGRVTTLIPDRLGYVWVTFENGRRARVQSAYLVRYIYTPTT